MIVILASACDNVEWGGADVRLEPPPPSPIGGVPDSVGTPGETEAIRLPTHPVLYMGERVDSSSTVEIVPVGEILGDRIVAFPSDRDQPDYRATFARERMGRGKAYVLFAEGVRVGTVVTRDLDTDRSFCTPRPTARGIMEIVPEAVDARRFLALTEEDAAGFSHGEYAVLETTYPQRVASIELTADLIRRVNARWPTSMNDARRDMEALRLDTASTPAFGATFLFRDRLDTSPAEASSWAIFLLGVLQGEDYVPAYTWYRIAGRDGKGAPRYFGRLDWDQDGQEEILLEVLGDGARWTAGIARSSGEWVQGFEEPCGANAAPATADGEGS